MHPKIRRTKKTSYVLFAIFGIMIIALSSCGHKNPSTEIEANTFSENSLEPKDRAYYHFTLSRYHLLNQRFADSLTELEITETYDPNSAYVKYNLALLYI